MTLFSIAIKNIKRNFYNYFLYFISMIFSIMIYYTFTSIQYNSHVLNLISSDEKIGSIFEASSIIIAIFATIFVWYSNSFFTKKRKKEMALYSILGLKKNQIGKMLFYENIFMGIIALAAGIFIGSLLSKLFIMILVKLIGFSVYIEFNIIPKAIINTVITFLIIFLVTAVHGYTIIYRFKLIELFRAESKGEVEPKTSITLSILSIVLIFGGYLIYLNIFKLHFDFLLMLLAILTTTIVGTYIFFSSFTVLIVKLAKKNKDRYYKGINIIGTSNLLHGIRSNSKTLATIAILSAITLTSMGLSASVYYELQSNLDIRQPFTYIYASNDKNLDKKVDSIIAKYPKNKIINDMDINFLKVDAVVPNVRKTIDSNKAINKKIVIISESMFDEIAKARGLKDKINIKDSNEGALFYENYNKASMVSYIGKAIELKSGNMEDKVEIVNFNEYSLVNEYMVGETLVVKDNIYNKYYDENNVYRIRAYITDNKKDSEKLSKELRDIFSEESSIKERIQEKQWLKGYFSYYDSYKSGLKGSGLSIFISSFVGLVFLLATGSIIFFKQMSQASEYKIIYKTLMNIGVSKKEIRASIAKQTLFVFALPLIIGVIHSSVAVSILGRASSLNLTIPILISIGAYTIIYFIYYILTVNSCNKIVSSKL